MNDKEIQSVIERIRELSYEGVTLTDIEKELNMPQNCLSGMLNGTRPFAKKWQPKLLAFVQSKKKPIKKATAGPKKEKPAPIQKQDPAPVQAEENIPPAGLSRTQILRRLREHGRQ